jgi:peptide/nickel transport system substrate-binding protein
VAWQVFEGLVEIDALGRLQPALAVEWKTEDGRVWRFRLRQGVYFHPSPCFRNPGGTRILEAADVKASFERLLRPESTWAFAFKDSVEGVEDFLAGKASHVSGFRVKAPDELEVVLKQPEAGFVYKLAHPAVGVFPREGPENCGEAWGRDVAIGTGPFRLESRKPGEVVLVRHEKYWGSPPALKRLVFRVIPNDRIRLLELRQGRIQVMSLPISLIPEVLDPHTGKLKVEGLRMQAVPIYDVHFIGFNLRDPAVQDIHLRRAVFYGVNRREIIEKALYGAAEPVIGFIPEGMQGYRGLSGDPYDPNRAREELRQVPESRRRDLVLLVHDRAESERVGQLVQAQLEAVGLSVRLRKVDFNTAISEVIRGNVPMFSLWFEYVYAAPEYLLEAFMSSKTPAPNLWGYSNPEVDRAATDLPLVRSPEERLNRIRALEARIVQDLPAVFLYRTRSLVLTTARVRGLQVTSWNRFILRDVRIEQ